jgi:hypothetical protein
LLSQTKKWHSWAHDGTITEGCCKGLNILSYIKCVAIQSNAVFIKSIKQQQQHSKIAENVATVTAQLLLLCKISFSALHILICIELEREIDADRPELDHICEAINQ